MHTKLKVAFVALGAALAGWAIAATVIIPSQTVTVTIPAQTVTITVPAQTVTVPDATTPPVVTPPVVTPPASGALWVYHNGVFLWPGDWNGAATTMNYADTTGSPGARDISMQSTQAWAYWLPYAPIMASTGKPGLDISAYSTLTLQVKPTKAGQKWSMGVDKYLLTNGVFTDDIAVGSGLPDISPYCKPAIAAGVWSTCNIPLTALQAKGLTTFYKFIFQDQTGSGTTLTYIQEVGFLP